MQHKTAEKCLNFTLECLISFVWMSKKSVQVWGESPLKKKRGRRKMGITSPVLVMLAKSGELRMVPPFFTMHMFCTSWDGLRNSAFLRMVPTNTKIFLYGL